MTPEDKAKLFEECFLEDGATSNNTRQDTSAEETISNEEPQETRSYSQSPQRLFTRTVKELKAAGRKEMSEDGPDSKFGLYERNFSR